MENDLFVYNTIDTPTVVGLLRNILTQYPDNGQIIKELVQNGEDAGATQVIVLHDTREFGPVPPARGVDFHRFIKGPALCLYNDAVFTEADWKGIRRLSDSIKKNDPLKVGQFGLGFKSVFHMTDCVTILSGKYVLFMDPSEPERTMCRTLPLEKLTTIIPQEKCTELWGEYLTTQNLSHGYLPATIFWFPLRQTPSDISATIYTPDRMGMLFHSFRVEAAGCLTFLKSLEKLSMKIRYGSGRGDDLFLEVALKSSDMKEVRCARETFRRQLEECNGSPAVPLSCLYNVTISSTTAEDGNSEQKLCILHYVPGSGGPAPVWRGDPSQHHIAHVGIAAAMETESPQKSAGQIFCFLPLPPGSANNTNLPVQVHGFFCLSQNRRHVKWMTDEGSQEPDVLWNEELVRLTVTEAYLELLLAMLEKIKANHFGADAWYSILPDVESTKGRWKELASSMWSKLYCLPIFYSEVLRSMITPQEAVTDLSLSSEEPCVAEAVRRCLALLNTPFVSVKQSILKSLSSVGVHLVDTTPKFLRKMLKQTSNQITEWDWKFRVMLLQYILTDMDFDDLENIPLLPLNNGEWTTFSRFSQPIYICRREEAGALLGMDGEILFVDLPSSLMEKLQSAASFGTNQLCIFNANEHCATLLGKSTTYVQRARLSTKQVKSWLQLVWSLLQNVRLEYVDNLSLVPTSRDFDSAALIPLSSAIVKQNYDGHLSQACIDILSLLNVQVIHELPSFVAHFQLPSYFTRSDAEGVTQVLNKIANEYDLDRLKIAVNSKLSEAHIDALCQVLDMSRIQGNLKTLLKGLKLFRGAYNTNCVFYTSIDICQKIVPANTNFPFAFPETLIMPVNEPRRQLAMVLGAMPLLPEDLYLLAFESTQVHGRDYFNTLIEYALNNSLLLNDTRVRKKLQESRFVSTEGQRYLLPCETYDPEDSERQALLGEDLYPSQTFQKHLPILRELGLQTVQSMPRKDLIAIGRRLQSAQLTKEDKMKKASSLFMAINRRQDCRMLCHALMDIPCIYGVSTKPERYPKNLRWETSLDLITPRAAKCEMFKDICGSVIPLVSCSHIPHVAEAFGWKHEPNVEQVVNHLQNIINSYQASEFEYIQLIKNTYRHLAQHFTSSTLITLQSLPSVFTEYGFKRPKEVYTSVNEGDIKLLPYLYPLPFDLREHSGFFMVLGCFESQTTELFVFLLGEIQNRHVVGEEVNPEVDRRLVISILRKLQDNIKDIDPSQLLLPIETEDGSLRLIEIGKCSYSSEACEWLDSEELSVSIVHRDVGASLAESLGVESLSKHMLAGEEAFMEWGQYEPLTTRLHNLLRQYRDGLAVFKEMVQNADDAGARTVSFLYDERLNKDARTRLINAKLQECQGPALWVYNDANFTEVDFENLRKLGAATKEHQPTKIGKFGLGFSSVYNLTDVPSFVSGTSYVIFDPHLSYVEGKNQTPGVRYNFAKEKNSVMLKKLSGQFKPFKEVFGCDIQNVGSYDGTLFRLPLRTPQQAVVSDICKTSYQRAEMIELLKKFSDIIGEILLFTQNVKEIKVFHLKENALLPEDKVLLMESSRKEKEKTRIQQDMLVGVSSAESIMECVGKLFREDHTWKQEEFHQNIVLNITVTHTADAAKLCNIRHNTSAVTWFTSWHTGHGDSCRLAEKLSGKALPVGAVAAPLQKAGNSWQPIELDKLPHGFYKKSHMHCFLPLPVSSSLMVQINGFFEVASDRTSLCTRTEDDRISSQDWNTTLIRDAVTAAYHTLLTTIRLKGLDQNCKYYTLWPLCEEVHDSLASKLSQSFYKLIVENNLTVFRDESLWLPFSKCLFLEESIHQTKSIGKYAFNFMRNILEASLKIVELPERISSGFAHENISRKIITPEQFFECFFIPNMRKQFVKGQRKNLTLYALDHYPGIAQKKGEIFYIATTPNGNLKKVHELILPNSDIAPLYEVSDERFPEEVFLNSGHRRDILKDLGIMTSKITIEMICERAQTVKDLACTMCGIQRASHILKYLNTNDNICKEIKDISFLPVMPKPEEWIVSWRGESFPPKLSTACKKHRQKSTSTCSISFSKPESMCCEEIRSLAGSTHAILDKSIPFWVGKSLVWKSLGMITNEKDLPSEIAINQLNIFREELKDNWSRIGEQCHQIYKYLDKCIIDNDLDVANMTDQKILLTKFGFIEPNRFICTSNENCAPDLFSVETENLSQYKHLMNALNIKKHFHPKTVFEILLSKKGKHKTTRLSNEEVCQISRLLHLLFNEMACYPNSEEEIDLSQLHLPDSDGRLVPLGQLCIDDNAMLSSGKFKYLNEKFSLTQNFIDRLGLKTKSRKRLEESCNRLAFGQHELLTTRLRNILKEYPCDSGIMKELLQNADDAGASEISFIKDFRHHSDKKILDKSLAPLQGPALCVYNNKCFQEKDIKGIQNLGDSSKEKDPASTGQYGIGFNAVYHLTDAPSFLTRGPDTLYGEDQRETLCLFDPHCWYDPLATKEYPGAQYVNLDNLRKDYPDSFSGYLDGMILKEEGTVFRLPLRTRTDSDISNTVMTPSELEEKIEEFKEEMRMCLLFLRSVRKISIKHIKENGECVEEYCVDACITDEDENMIRELRNYMSQRRQSITNKDNLNDYFLNMMRISYKMEVKDNLALHDHWYVTQQLGAESSQCLPSEEIQQEFLVGSFNLLPHAGIAILLDSTSKINSEQMATSCYLPLPAKSGLPFSVNGHLILNSSRRDLWTGNDLKHMWNEWLMKEVMIPAAIQTVSLCKELIFCGIKETVAYGVYKKKARKFYCILPNPTKINDKWKKFSQWFLEYVDKHQISIFNVFTPHTDISTSDDCKYGIVARCRNFFTNPKETFGHQQRNQALEELVGTLTWHSLTKDGDQFPLYFSNDTPYNLLNSLKRLGMKIGTRTMEQRLKGAKVSYFSVTPDVVLGFFLSWTSQHPDRCKLNVENHIETTPILSDKNACEILSYLFLSEKFAQEMNNFPMLLTQDHYLHVFSEVEPVFISSYSDLLPHSRHEFLHDKMVKKVWSFHKQSLPSVLRPFSVSDLAERIETVLDQSFKNTDIMKLSVVDGLTEEWLKRLWYFVHEDIKQNFSSNDNEVDWERGKMNLLAMLGDWPLYPITVNNTSHFIPIKNAYCVLQTDKSSDSFNQLPIPRPHNEFDIPIELGLAATLDNPEAVLRALHFHRDKIGASAALRNRSQNIRILEYFGEKINKQHRLCREQLRSLPLYENISGKYESVTDKEIIVPVTTNIKAENFKHFIEGNGIALLKATTSETLKNLYIYLDSSCIMEDLEIYSQYVLPNLKDMDSEERVKHLKFLRGELEKIRYSQESSWPTKERNVITQLRVTPFIPLGGSLQTADHFYDPLNAVFEVMGLCNLPNEWCALEWQWFLKLVGMKHEISSKMYLKYIKSLSITDPNVEVKSTTLVEHLFSNHKELEDSFCEIRDIEFIVPFKSQFCESISSHYETSSGLTSFSKSYPTTLGNLVWTSACLLPYFALPHDKELKEKLNISSTPSENTVFNHIRNICTELQKNSKSEEKVSKVMADVYEYLMKANNDALLEKIVCAEIPVIHIPHLKTFVTTNLVVLSLDCSLAPYLYKAPTKYGLYFPVFERMGVQAEVTNNTYAKALNMIGMNSQNNVLNPEEFRCVKTTLNGMLRDRWNLKDIEVCELFLPTSDRKLSLSSCMYVADTLELERALWRTLDKPLLMNFECLKNYSATNVDFVKLLPERLRPTFLSSVVKQEFKEHGINLVNSQIVREVLSGLETQEFKTAVLRVFNHASQDKLCKEKEKEILDKLECVSLKTVAEITVDLKFQGQVIGSKTYTYGYHLDDYVKNEIRNIIIYLCQTGEEKFLLLGLSCAFRRLLGYTGDTNEHMMAIFMSLQEPSEIHQLLDRKGIKASANSQVEDSVRMYKSDVGSYLHVDFIHLLDNELYSFHEGELVCMKKYIHGELLDREEDIFIIVQVKRRVTSFDNPIHDEYEVDTGSEAEPLLTVKAYKLYKFIRKATVCRDIVPKDSVPEEDDEDAVMKNVRMQVIEIWKVEDPSNRKHLLRRLMLKWHPDKNPEKVELATRVMQYIQSLLSRLECGEIIPEDDDHNTFPSRQPSSFYEDIFRSPPSYYREPRSSSSGTSSFSYSRGPSSSSHRNQERTRMPDKPEAHKWLKQADHDLKEAERRGDGSSCWITYMCHQAAEKVLKAALYLEDRDAAQSYQSGSQCHSLTAVAQQLSCSSILSLARDMECHVGHHTYMRYPTSLGVPCDRYAQHDAEFMLEKAADLMKTLKPRFPSL